MLSDSLWIVVIGALVGGACGLAGCFLVLRRMALLGDAISHAVLPGIAIAVLLSGSLNSWPVFVGATALGLLTAFLVQLLNKSGRVQSDAAIGVTFTALFAIGVVIVSQVQGTDLDTDCVLYGEIAWAPQDVLNVAGRDIGPRAFWQMSAVFALCLLVVAVFFKELKISAFDPEMATAVGINVTLMHYVLMALVSVTTVGAFESVGAILVVAMLIVPAATAYLLTDDLKLMLMLSVACGALSSALGYALTHFFVPDASIAGAMTVMAGLLFTLALLFSPRHGVVAKGLARRRLSQRIGREDALQVLWRQAESAQIESAQIESAQAESAQAESGSATSRPSGAAARTAALDAVGVAALTQTEIGAARAALHGLQRSGLAQAGAASGFVLTEAGRRAAQELVHRHRVYESYLGGLGYPEDHLHEAADRAEHFISPQLVQSVDASIGNPTTDPHGKPIPHDSR